MRKFLTCGRSWVLAVSLAAVAAPVLAPAPASAWWYRGGYGRPVGVVVARRPVVVVRPRVVYVPRRVWVAPGWAWNRRRGRYWVPGHWRY